MRVLFLAEIHANWPALQAVQENCDACFFVGDLVDYGLEPSPCIDWIRQYATACVRGNHDHGAAQNVQVTGRNGFRYLTSITRPVTQERLSHDERRFLAAMPITRYFTFDDKRFLLVHGSPRDPLDEYGAPNVEFWSQRLKHVQADVICVGHTH